MKKIRFTAIALLLSSVIPFSVPVPAKAAEIVDPAQVYSYERMSEDIRLLAQSYPELIETKSIGKTHYGRDIWAVRLGSGDANVFVNASHHAREWMTTNLTMTMIDRYALLYQNGGALDGRDVRSVLDNCAIWFVPMVNPDGVTLQQQGVSAFPDEARANLLAMNGGRPDFTSWKANALGVDPNRQYPAEWETITNPGAVPAFKNYKGNAPLQAEEAKAMVAFTKEIDPEMELAYHSSGGILYWNFHTPAGHLERDRAIVKEAEALTGYAPVKPEANPSGGGYTDWFIQTYGRPGLTPEIGRYSGEAGVPLSEFARIWKENRSMGLFAAERGFQLWKDRIPVQYGKMDLTLQQSASLHGEPDSRHKMGASLSAQSLIADARKGDWYRVDTWLGNAWVHVERPILGKVEAKETALALTRNTKLYREPTEGSSSMGELAPQNVTAFEQRGNWYRIHSWLGDVWLRP